MEQGQYSGTITKAGYTTYSFTGSLVAGQTVTVNGILTLLPAPVISSVSAVSVTTHSATITWTTDQPSDSRVSYGTSPAYGSSATNATMTTNHSVTLTNLDMQTQYYFGVTSQNSNGLSSSSDGHTFTTTPGSITIVITSPANGATITRSDTVVTGTFANSFGNQTEVTVNGMAATVNGNLFAAYQVPLTEGINTITATATDTGSHNEAAASIDVTVMNDDANIYCMGTGTYVVGPSNFTSGIPVPTAGNAVLIASPFNGATINGPKVIVKGAMDTTIPVSSVMVVVSSGTGTAGYLAQVSGAYFAAKVQVAADTYGIAVIATDQTGTQHQASVSVYPVIQSNTVELMANPSVGLLTLKQNGKTTLDASLMSTPSITSLVASYAWDFSGTGTSDLTCYSHSNVEASYEHTGLYLTQVSVTDTAGNRYNDTAIVNVLDRTEIDNRLKPIWNGMKTTLVNQDIESTVSLFVEDARVAWRQHFTRLSQYLPQMAADMGELRLVQATDCLVEYDLRTIRNGEEYSFQVLFMKDQDGVWRIKSF